MKRTAVALTLSPTESLSTLLDFKVKDQRSESCALTWQHFVQVASLLSLRATIPFLVSYRVPPVSLMTEHFITSGDVLKMSPA